jgi:hypothetical protein
MEIYKITDEEEAAGSQHIDRHPNFCVTDSDLPTRPPISTVEVNSGGLLQAKPGSILRLHQGLV